MRRKSSFGLSKLTLSTLLVVGSACAVMLVQGAQADPGPSLGINGGGKPKRPQVSGFTPSNGPAGTTVTVSGSNLSGATSVAFNGASASYTVNSSSQLTTTVPVNATSGPISVTNGAGTGTSSSSFTITSGAPPAPTITSFNPTSGATGTVVKIAGTNFTGATSVLFNGTTATYTVDSATQVTATVPAGATTGPITLTTAGGKADSASFTVTSPPAAFFVSPTGSDATGDGTISKPFATLGKAQAAMRLSSTKTTYIRGGHYSLPSVTQNGVTYGLYLTSADSGETWSYYPADGYNSAILDGGSTGANTGIQELITIDGASNVTVNGLQLQHFRWVGIGLHGGGGFYQLFPSGSGQASSNTITNNLVHDGSYDLSPIFGYGGGGFYGEGKTPNTTITNNAFYNIAAFGIEAQVGNAGQGGSIDSLLIANNAVLSTCQLENDCGGIYVQDKNTTSTGIKLDNNFVRDVGYNAYPARSIYLDDGVSGASVTHNVVAAGLYVWAFTIHGGRNDTLSSNIVDLGGGNNREILLYEGDGLTDMKGNVMSSNVVISGGGGGGFEGNSFNAQPTIANNAYHNYSGATIYSGGYKGLNGDGTPASLDPQLTCWAYKMAAGSPVYNAPVSFDSVPGGWGPPGYSIPQTGTPPSQPHGC